MESGSFQEDQIKESAFCHVYGRGLVWCNEEVLQPEKADQIPQFEVRNDLHYSIDKGREDQREITQLLVPPRYNKYLNQLAHDGPLSGHLRHDKMGAHLMQRFYWPGLYKEVERYCETCPICQKTSVEKPPVAAVVMMLVIGKPFERITLDVTGLLAKSRMVINMC